MSFAFMFFVAAVGVSRAEISFPIINGSSSDLIEFRIGDPEDDTYGPDLMDGDVLSPGEQMEISVEGDSEICVVHVLAVFADGARLELRHLDKCQYPTGYELVDKQ
ncbi:MAG: hypothetical protein AAF401_03135 [Pseudomonadota bacterium]